jgi:hypothetical protein
MKNNNHSLIKPLGKGNKTQNKQNVDAKQLFRILFKRPISRRMSATKLGYTDQTYMVTQIIYDWIKCGKAQVVGRIRCTRSERLVEAVTTNPKYFKSRFNNQLETYD